MSYASPHSGPNSSRAVSPVVGVILMAAIVVVLAAVVASLAVGFEGELQEPAPSGGFDREYAPSGEGNTDNRPYVVITHEVGRTVDADNVLIKDDAGNSIYWDDVWTGGPKVHAGEYVHIDGFASDAVLEPICEGRTYWVILQNEDGDSLVVNKWTASTPPRIPTSSPLDSNDNHVPDHCPND